MLTPSQFTSYPPQARTLASAHLVLLRQLPLAFLPSMLRELIEYDYKFPIERMKIDREFDYLESLSAASLASCFDAFSHIRFTEEQTSFNWCGRPLDFTEQLSAYLWRTHQISAFRDAAVAYKAAVFRHPLADLVDENPFGVTVGLRAKLGPALDRIAAA